MTFLVWRQYRVQWAVALALLAAFAVVELLNGLQVAHAWHSLLTTCPRDAAARSGPGDSCLQGTITGSLGDDLRLIAELVPALFGIFWGAPLVAQEMEAGTTTFAWTQGITRARWLWVKVGWLLLAAALWGGAIAALVTWWSGPVNAQQGNAFLVNNFDTQGIVPIGYSVFAMALGIAAGALIRRTLPAIAVTIVGFAAVRLVVAEELRQHLISPITTVASLMSNWAPSGASWIISNGFANKAGHALASYGNYNGPAFNGTPVSDFPAACQRILNSSQSSGNAFNVCLARAGFQQYFSYQPGYRFWPIQGIETGLYLVVAAVLLAIAWLALRRRDA
jgi:ABC-type transport system involved in multi-copper enzyme maturation permease subunit